MSPLLITMLAVSCASLILQGTALAHLLRQRASYCAERLAGGGLIRSAATRTGLACMYTAASAAQMAGVRIPGAGVLGPEALVIFVVAQTVWLSNALLDIHIRHRLRERGGNLAAGLERKV